MWVSMAPDGWMVIDQRGGRMQVGQEEARGRHGDAGAARHLGWQGGSKSTTRARMRSGAGPSRHSCFASLRRNERCTERAHDPYQGSAHVAEPCHALGLWFLIDGHHAVSIAKAAVSLWLVLPLEVR